MSVVAGSAALAERLSKEIFHLVRTGTTALVDFIYPNQCLVCGDALQRPSERVCTSCLAQIPHLGTSSGSLQVGTGTDAVRPVDCLAVWKYEEPLPTLIHAMKYRGMWKLSAHLSPEMARCIRAEASFAGSEWLVPVPLHRTRERQRGFNQSRKLAEGIGAITGQRVIDALQRVRNTRTQTALSAEARRHNVRDAFRVRRRLSLAGRRIILVDDVLTTGATAQECARALWEAGAAEVRVAVVARA